MNGTTELPGPGVDLLVWEQLVRSIAINHSRLEVKFRRSVGAVDAFVRAESSDVAKLVGKAGVTINALAVIGKAILRPTRFQIWKIEQNGAGGSVNAVAPAFDRESVGGWLRQVCEVVFRREGVDEIRWSDRDNEVSVTLRNSPEDRKQNAAVVGAVMDVFEAIGQTRGLRGERRLRVRITVPNDEAAPSVFGLVSR